MFFYPQAKKSKEDLKEVTHKVYFDVEIDGKPAGMDTTQYSESVLIRI